MYLNKSYKAFFNFNFKVERELLFPTSEDKLKINEIYKKHSL